jgi:hypothetical protein
MDLAILRGAISMGEEYCSQDDEVSEFGWILWSSFLVFCKFVYLRPVFHLHQLGVFHSSRADAAKSALIELGSMILSQRYGMQMRYRIRFWRHRGVQSPVQGNPFFLLQTHHT